MKNLFRWILYGLTCLVIIGLGGWGSLAIWFTQPVETEVMRGALIAVFVVLCVAGMVGILFARWTLLFPFILAFLLVLGWWFTIEPRNDRQWQPDVATLARAEIDGDKVTLRNIRNFAYRSETDFTPRWYDKTVDLNNLETLDLIAVYWMGDAIAHTLVSFGFGGDYVAFSIEIRKERDESFSTIGGLFRRYELYYVVGDERDLIGLRTTYRNPAEDVYLYRVKARKEGIRRLFLQYIHRINKLNERPEFYNTLTTNCTTNIVTHVRAFSDRMPLSWKMLASGYFPELIYEQGALYGDQPFADLRAQSLINARARKADGAENFSSLIREGLPGMR